MRTLRTREYQHSPTDLRDGAHRNRLRLPHARELACDRMQDCAALLGGWNGDAEVLADETVEHGRTCSGGTDGVSTRRNGRACDACVRVCGAVQCVRRITDGALSRSLRCGAFMKARPTFHRRVDALADGRERRAGVADEHASAAVQCRTDLNRIESNRIESFGESDRPEPERKAEGRTNATSHDTRAVARPTTRCAFRHCA